MQERSVQTLCASNHIMFLSYTTTAHRHFIKNHPPRHDVSNTSRFPILFWHATYQREASYIPCVVSFMLRLCMVIQRQFHVVIPHKRTIHHFQVVLHTWYNPPPNNTMALHRGASTPDNVYEIGRHRGWDPAEKH